VSLKVLSVLSQNLALFFQSYFKLVSLFYYPRLAVYYVKNSVDLRAQVLRQGHREFLEALNTLRVPIMRSTVNRLHFVYIRLNVSFDHFVVFSQLVKFRVKPRILFIFSLVGPNGKPIAAQEGI
jgi:hypothetical protein